MSPIRAAVVHPSAPRGLASMQSLPLFRFGVVADVQHADIPDGSSFHGVPRYYRGALQLLQRAVDDFKEAHVNFAMHLGDIVDFHNSVTPAEASAVRSRPDSALQDVLDIFTRLEAPVYHMLGNHCLYCHSRPVLNQRLGISELQGGQRHSYYAVQPLAGWRVLVLDGYDVSLLGWEPGHPLHELAEETLQARNPNKEKNSPDGLEGTERRFVKFGGGLSDAQLVWMRGQLGEARAAGDRVVVACHLPMHPDTCPPVCLLWNYEQVLEVLQAFPGTVVATLAGHTHRDGYCRDSAGIHHRVCAAILETPPGNDCHGIIEVFDDRIRVVGHGRFQSDDWSLGPVGHT
uniref:Calcineurin-like phosphoesterase domain-containing protein n=2 Tax=Auxenochlorella protothecoides TaxID=3075 RepID=A0A1D2A4L9_AUXPR